VTVAKDGQELRRLKGTGQGADAVTTGIGGYKASSIYNADSIPPWELLLVRKPGPTGGQEPKPKPPLREIISQFDEFAAVAYAQGPGATINMAIHRAFDRCVD